MIIKLHFPPLIYGTAGILSELNQTLNMLSLSQEFCPTLLKPTALFSG